MVKPLSYLCAALLIVSSACRSAGVPAAPKRVLILTGEDYAGHDWKRTAPLLASQLAEDSRLSVEVHDDLTTLATLDLDPFAAVVVHFKNYDPEVPGRAGFDNLARFRDGGGGLVLVHFACGAFEEFADEYEDLVGRVWMGAEPPPGRAQHDPYGEFTVRVLETGHAVTRDLESFTTSDELYTCLVGDVPIEVLADGVSVRDDAAYPLAFTLTGDAPRVFHCTLGHDVAALSTPAVAELYRRGTAWAAGLPPVSNHEGR